MIKNPLLFILNASNDYLRYTGIIKALSGYREEIVVITPQPITQFLSVSMMPTNASFNRFEQYVLPTAEKGRDYLDVNDPLYQTVFDWNVFRVEIKEKALSQFAAFRSGDISFSFAFQKIEPSSKSVTFKGFFGNDNPLPVTADEGDFYECEDYNFQLVSGVFTYSFSKGMFVYWNGERWVKDRLKTKGTTSSVNLPVEPSHAVGYELEDDEVNTVESVIADVVTLQGDVQEINGKIENIEGDIDDLQLHVVRVDNPHDVKANQVDFDTPSNFTSDNVQDAIEEVQTNLDDYETANDSRVLDVENEIDDIKDGTTIVKKAEQDENGNNIVDTYETKTNATIERNKKVDKDLSAYSVVTLANNQNIYVQDGSNYRRATIGNLKTFIASDLVGFGFVLADNDGDGLPDVAEPETNKIYLVLTSEPEQDNIYNEFIWLNEAWELIGTTQVELKWELDGEDFIKPKNDRLVKADKVFYDKSVNGLDSENAQDAITELDLKKVNIADLGTISIVFYTTADSDIGGYKKLVTSNDDEDYDQVAQNVSSGTITTQAQLIGAYASEQGIFIGTIDELVVTTTGKIRRTAGSGTASFYFEVYKRDDDNVETLICESGVTNNVDDNFYAQYSATGILDEVTFTETDRLVIKWYGERIAGGSNPTYNFMIGGSTPTKTVFPVAFNILPLVNHNDLKNIQGGQEDEYYHLTEDELTKLQNAVEDITGDTKVWRGTQAEYEALGTYDENTLYFIKEEKIVTKIFLGTTELEISNLGHVTIPLSEAEDYSELGETSEDLVTEEVLKKVLDDEDYAKNDEVQKKLLTESVEILVEDWSVEGTVTKTVTGVTSTNIVWVSPVPASFDKYGEFGVRATTQGTNQLTFQCSEIPDATINVNIVIGEI